MPADKWLLRLEKGCEIFTPSRRWELIVPLLGKVTLQRLNSAKARYQVDLSGVKTLELIVQKGFQSNGGNWGLWLDPTLFREPAIDK